MINSIVFKVDHSIASVSLTSERKKRREALTNYASFISIPPPFLWKHQTVNLDKNWFFWFIKRQAVRVPRTVSRYLPDLCLLAGQPARGMWSKAGARTCFSAPWNECLSLIDEWFWRLYACGWKFFSNLDRKAEKSHINYFNNYNLYANGEKREAAKLFFRALK